MMNETSQWYRALKLNPVDIESMRMAASYFYAQQEFHQAIYYLRDIVRIYPNDLASWILLAKIEHQLGWMHELATTMELTHLLKHFGKELNRIAAPLFGEGLELGSQDRFSSIKAERLIERGFFGLAADYLQKHIKAGTCPPTARSILAKALLFNKEINIAARVIEHALKIEPTNPEIKTQSARISFLNSDKKKAAAISCEAIAHANPSSECFAVHSLILADEGQFKEAMSYLDIGMRLDPSYELLTVRALIKTKLGLNEEAIEAANMSLQMNPNQGRTWTLLGKLHARTQNIAKASSSFARAIRCDPTNPSYWDEYARTLMEQGDINDAEKVFEQAVKLPGVMAMGKINAGLCKYKLGRSNEAIELFEAARSQEPKNVTALTNLGTVYKEQEQWQKSIACFDEAISLLPKNASLHAARANSLLGIANFSEAQRSAEVALKLEPDNFMSMTMLAGARIGLNDHDGAKAILDNLQPKSKTKELQYQLGLFYSMLWSASNNWPSLEACARSLLTIKPDYNKAYSLLASALRHQHRYSEATSVLHSLLKLNPNSANTVGDIGSLLAYTGSTGEAIHYLERAVSLEPDNLRLRTNLCFWLNHYEKVSAAEIFNAHKAYGEVVERNFPPRKLSFTNQREPQKKLRLGFVSGDLFNHAVANFLEPVISMIDKAQFELYFYSNNPFKDSTTDRLKTYSSKWSVIHSRSDASVWEEIREDQIDILIDLSGHTSRNRLPVFSMRAAPVQMSWIGYLGTTGVKEMDYFPISKEIEFSGTVDHLFTESLIKLPLGIPFSPSDDSPDISDLPSIKKGFFTFGSFNRPSKISDSSILLWARVLLAVPNSRMLVGAMTDGPATTERIMNVFKNNGITGDRLKFIPRSPMRNYLESHADVDLLLDTIPYGGGTTTCHGLWMGVPTLSCAGEPLLTRLGALLLAKVGLNQFIATSHDDLVDRARYWAQNTTELAVIRKELRKHPNLNPDISNRVVVHQYEAAFRHAWSAWCKGLSHQSFGVS
jgi:protein O-GlcNAc transferase